jgi:hypothetical protein
MPITDEIIDLERRGWEALATDGQAATAFYEEVLDDDPVVLLPGGMVVKDRAAIVDSMSGAAWSRYDLEDLDARALGDGAATVTYGVVAEREGADPYSALIASTYVRRDGAWRLALHQQTPR